MGILCKVTRGDYIESIHVAYAAVVDEKGEVVFAAGDPDYVTCVRSALKPFQAASAVETGAVDSAGFTDEELALMCASHNGENIHVNTAQSMLNKLGFTEADCECGSHPPYHRETESALLASGKKWTALHNNCSGKHIGMLCLAKHFGSNISGYTQRDHPVQEAIFRYLKTLTGLKQIPYAIDGCSAPTPFMSLKHVAVLYQKLAGGYDPVLGKPMKAMTGNPYLVAGDKRFDTIFNEHMSGRAVTKVGGEAIRGLGIKTTDGTSFGIALKVLDGTQRAAPPAAMAVLKKLNLLTEEEQNQLNGFTVQKLYNHRQIHTGKITAEIEP